MESHKTYQAINPVELAKISQELIVKNCIQAPCYWSSCTADSRRNHPTVDQIV